ncbi:MAG TPA: molybdopterin molybdotransferase MoeA [Methanothrix sp.]|jgi:molybdopterin molybdotransferase|nr:molybdopterin molybdotransferase MoeA [Methanothrix sp.]HPC89300.1 molybdopterin molybdotransferase MoeA [Methanothrix sp.]HQE87307.1 molybdopterin molybdotransferase MoeA [Methanothrix sp.]HQI67687.1 molybdopterin molybdotransferase MoeA [Methanothrix sp.]HRS85195.1 molybdopterin molybdotransferase MoeA [Methanothrix sp.]
MFKRFCGALDALQMLLEHCMPLHRTESLPASQSAGRVLSEDILSPVSLPAFDRAAMDGYAVRSADTAGGRPHAPVFIEDFLPARTGQPVPPPYDAVLMLEDAELRGRTLQSTAQLHAGKNVSREGEDIAAGERVFSAGHCLRIPDAALLMALGVEEAAVWQRPKVTVIPTGGELVEAGTRPLSPGEAYEINGLMARLYAERWGAEAQRTQIVPDDEALIREAVAAASLDSDFIIIIGGTSVGEKDYAPSMLAEMGELFVHGVRLQPGKPTAFGSFAERPVVCLPGYPVAMLSDLYLFVRPALQKIGRRSDRLPRTRVPLKRKIPSRPGYLSLVRVAIREGKAEPIMIAGAGILSSVARADGFVVVPEEREGLEAGEMVNVTLFE